MASAAPEQQQPQQQQQPPAVPPPPPAPAQATAAAAAPPVPQPAPGTAPYEYQQQLFNGITGIEPNALLKILRSLPGVFPSVSGSDIRTFTGVRRGLVSPPHVMLMTAFRDHGRTEHGHGEIWTSGLHLDPANQKQDAAQALSNLSQYPQQGLQYPPPAGIPGINEPGPSSHPRGPPTLNQLTAAVAMQVAPTPVQGQQPPADGAGKPPTQPAPVPTDPNAQASTSAQPAQPPPQPAPAATPAPTTTGGRRQRNPAIGTDEWARQRKDNHKEVERRRRGNINEGINELGRIVPNGTGEKAKGAILARAVQYIHHLKENEARNIEKWTLEKLLMDQAMGDLQAQLEEVKRLWDEERTARQRLEAELELLRGRQSAAPKDEATAAGTKRRSEEEGGEAPAASAAPAENAEERDGKRQRTE
ncbi:hypothetical protein CC1G_01657 [Coprinopsis cinerea okayama7|uniref:BHLH domain-containing protein n=1 Tax=Coprinopsis cinerea (strain Okayama-7 / 130 / ATCC MYA-4618 / FGSC 9003) TaxID=240176 RepID=A8NIE2_COPC7|nr:hypothetical protein CC1G_01657 [Coprinopsis cinerea okayama7\|eukprot:XP_001833980.2 hypothetical protein CC1G_01657 [Coprinopsis cinerea okayama7\